ncbi:TetR family transcriptional regulator [Aeromicrobium sp. Root495]|uniref:TetR family transcriptional regulator n=1 Tax=Aeromicrobium sp. Root495 TaxID=1736550 RepID=UPI000B1AF2D1|nr:TetR family transcriptional regulator [Aeromicrobium sp. Root495]
MSTPEEPELTRTERKERTRRAILDAALELSEQGSLSALSLRHVAREVGIAPNAFYRHFASADELGLALVDELFGTLRQLLSDVRSARPISDGAIVPSLGVLVDRVHTERLQFVFLTRERVGGSAAVRTAIRRELELFEAEIALDFARMPGAVQWSSEDLRVSANLIVTALVAAVERLLYTQDRDGEQAIVAATEKQLRMLTIGARTWRSRPR